MKPSPSSKVDERDQRIIKILRDLGSVQPAYPSELLVARRAAFLEQVERLRPEEFGEELSAEDQEVVKLLGQLKSARVEYPAELLAARRSAFLRQMEKTKGIRLWDTFRVSLQRFFSPTTTTPASPPAGFLRISLVMGSLIALVCIGTLFLSRREQAFQPSPSQPVATPTFVHPTETAAVTVTICKPEEKTSLCPQGELDLADSGNGVARPAVSKDARASPDGAHQAAFVNDGRGGASWVSGSTDSWIKIDLGQVRTIDTVSLQKGSPGRSSDGDLGQVEIAVAASDVYADGDSGHDYAEYAAVFRSEQSGLHGMASPAATIRIQFPAVQARYIKLTFEKAGAAIEEVGVFMVRPREFAEQPTRTAPMGTPGSTLASANTNTPSLMDTATSMLTGTSQSARTGVPTLTNTPRTSDTPGPLPTNSTIPTDTSLPVPTYPLPTDTPIPLPTFAQPTIVQPSPTSPDPIVVTGHDQILTFTCNGNAVEVRGTANTVTLLGSCSSITVTGNRNHVYWQLGSPVIINRGKDNIIQQL